MAQKGHIAPEEIQRVLEATDIVSLVGGYVQLKTSGKNFMGLCPFHQERTPSFVVSPVKQNYHCYGCGVHGDAIRFLMDYEHLVFVDALRYLAERAGITLKTQAASPQDQGRGELAKCLEESLLFFRQNLKQAPPQGGIWSYLKKREIPEKFIERFQLGFIGDGWTQLHDHLHKKGISIKIMDACGLIKQGDKGGWYDRLRDRLIFPIRDHGGRLIGFAGRILGDGSPKYLNPPETDLYKKSSTFYGLFEAKEAIRKSRRAILVEGYLDVIRLHEKGWQEAIGVCGTSLTEEHIRVLKRQGILELVLLFDGDAAGIKAAERSAKLCLEAGMDSLVLILPEGLDPDDFFKKYSAAQFSSLLEKAPRDFSFLVSQTKGRIKEQGIAKSGEAISDLLSLADKMDEAAAGEFRRRVSEAFEMAQASSVPAPAKKIATPPAGRPNQPRFAKEDKKELSLLSYLLAQPKAMALAHQFLTSEDFHHPWLAQFYQRLADYPDLEELSAMSLEEFADIFIEYRDLIMYLGQNGRESIIGAYSEEKAQSLIYTLWKDAKKRHQQNIKAFSEEQQISSLQALKERNDKFETLNPRGNTR